MADQSGIAAEQIAIRDLISRINDAWIKQRGEAMTAALNECFADDVVMRGPGFAFIGKGRDLLVQSYRDFISNAELKSVSLDEPDIDVTGETATAQYKWTMTYVLGGQEYTEHGRDLFVIARRDKKWLAVWRALLPDPAANAPE
jgi:ketosteroid isomerase-like protein